MVDYIEKMEMARLSRALKDKANRTGEPQVIGIDLSTGQTVTVGANKLPQYTNFKVYDAISPQIH